MPSMNRRGFLASLTAAFVARRLDFSAWAYLTPAPAPNRVMTLADWAKLEPNGTTSTIAELLSRTNEMLLDTEWVP